MTSTSRNYLAGGRLRDLRVERGLSPEAVPHAMRTAGIDTRNIPSGRTIRRCEETGIVPQVRFRFGLASFYDTTVAEIWTRAEATR